jgi:hypothetical protein
MGIPRTTAKKIPAPDISFTSEFFDSAGQENYLSAPWLPDSATVRTLKNSGSFPKKNGELHKGALHPKARNLKQLLLTANRNNKTCYIVNIHHIAGRPEMQGKSSKKIRFRTGLFF